MNVNDGKNYWIQQSRIQLTYVLLLRNLKLIIFLKTASVIRRFTLNS